MVYRYDAALTRRRQAVRFCPDPLKYGKTGAIPMFLGLCLLELGCLNTLEIANAVTDRYNGRTEAVTRKRYDTSSLSRAVYFLGEPGRHAGYLIYNVEVNLLR